jgi:hypothetical protein
MFNFVILKPPNTTEIMDQFLLKIVEYHDDNGLAWRMEIVTKEQFKQALIRVKNNPSLSEKDCEQYYRHKYKIKCDGVDNFEWCVCPIINNTTIAIIGTNDHGDGDLDINENKYQPNNEILERILRDYYIYNHIDIDTSYDAHLEEMKGMYEIPEKDRNISELDFLEALYYAYQNNTIDQFYKQGGLVVVCQECGSETFIFRQSYHGCDYCDHDTEYDTYNVSNLRIIPPWEYDESFSNRYANPPKLSWWGSKRRKKAKTEQHLRVLVNRMIHEILNKINSLIDPKLPLDSIDQLKSIATPLLTEIVTNKTTSKHEKRQGDKILADIMTKFWEISDYHPDSETEQVVLDSLNSVIENIITNSKI